MTELEAENIVLQNSSNPLFEAMQSGRVYYEDGRFFGSFNSVLTRQIKDIGGAYDTKTKTYRLPESQLPISLRIAAETQQSNLKKLQSRLIDRLDSMDITDEFKQYEFEFVDTINRVNNDLEKTVGKFKVPVVLTASQKKIISEQWAENLQLYVKDWAEDNILKMRRQIAENVVAGSRARDMEKIIIKSYGSSQSKARFLARQETSLLTSKIRETRYKDLGLFKYVWQTAGDSRVRDEAFGGNHKRLDGKVFLWDSPPIVDTASGRRAHPGEDFNCRCVARPVIE